MKRIFLTLTTILFLVSCASAPVQPSITPTDAPRETSTSTSIPTRTSTPSTTPSPKLTVTPALPDTIKFTFEGTIPEAIQNDIKIAVDQAYWFYVGLGCSPEFHSVNIQAHALDLAGAPVDGVTWGWKDFANEPWRHMRITISHEMVHVMCQIALIKNISISLNPRWLLEGIANYFSEMEQIRFVPSGWGKNIEESELGMLTSLQQQNLCDFPLNQAEFDTDSGQLINRMPDYPAVGQAATIYLAKTYPGGIPSLIDFYSYLADHSMEDSFKLAFGVTKEEFYADFREKCRTGFADLAFTPTPLAAGTVTIHGTVTLEEGKQNFTDYFLTFCMGKCLQGVEIQANGTFTAYIPPGVYKISLNSASNGSLLGWYTKDGFVTDSSCAGGIVVQPDEKLDLPLLINTPKAC